MRVIFRLIISGWLLSSILASVSIAYGRFFPAPIVEWATISHYVHDTKIGISYPVSYLPEVEATPGIRRGQSIASPDGQYQMTVDRRNNGLNLRFYDREGQALRALLSNRDSEIFTVYWLNKGNILLIRNLLTSDTLNLVRFNVQTGEEQLISPYTGGTFNLSPGRNWLLLSDSLSGGTIVQHVEDERRYTLAPVLSNAVWTNDERYLAGSAMIENRWMLLVMDTTTGTSIAQDTVPERISPSGNNETFLVQTATGVALYRGIDFIFEQEITSPIVQTMWVSDGEYGIIVTEDSNLYSIYLVDISNHEQALRLLSTIPDTISLLSLQTHDDVFTYILNSPQYTESLIYRIRIPDGDIDLLSDIPAHFRQIAYYHSFGNYQESR